MISSISCDTLSTNKTHGKESFDDWYIIITNTLITLHLIIVLLNNGQYKAIGYETHVYIADWRVANIDDRGTRFAFYIRKQIA